MRDIMVGSAQPVFAVYVGVLSVSRIYERVSGIFQGNGEDIYDNLRDGMYVFFALVMGIAFACTARWLIMLLFEVPYYFLQCP